MINRRKFLGTGCAAALLMGAGVSNAESFVDTTAIGRAVGVTPSPRPAPSVSWTHDARIAGYGLRLARVDDIIKQATASHVFGIETDNDITGRYESFIDPAEKLKAIKAVAEKAHAAGNYTFVYISGLECIT
ncbi:MAG: twin-arginine translocation signal domain-containing protein, partial [Terriglobia bacterium]